MPSVRVRRSDNYLRLGENTFDPANALGRPATERHQSRPRSRTLNHIFGDTLPPRPPALQSQSDAHSVVSSNGTVSSTGRRLAPIPGSPPPNQVVSQAGELSEPNAFETLHAPQMELIIPAHPQPGLVGSSLLDRPTDDDDDGDDHHHDELVEHLEAIDPQIATVAGLTNAANSILIPPLTFYNRRPVISLPRRPDVDILLDTEKARENRGDYDELDQHVDDVLNKKALVRRTLQGLWTFIKTPQGAITAIYGFLCAFWGAAIVLFLGRLINVHNANTQGFWVEVSSQIENGLFTATGVGFIPWRVIDTYRIIKIWRFKKLTQKLRAKAGLPALVDEDDLPDPKYDPNYVHVLSDEQQFELHYQQHQFRHSQTWYRPHGTSTHRAFPINTALLICLLIDGNSFFQCLLCGCMWGLNRFQRPAWTTGSLIPASFLCGIAAAICIWRGGQKTRRTKEVEERLKAALMFEKHTGVPAGITAATACKPVPIKAKTEPPPADEDVVPPEVVRNAKSEPGTPEPASTSSPSVLAGSS